MIEQNSLKPIRKVAVADHLWACFEQMAQEMGSDRDALINQALFMFARLNGFLAAGTSGAPASPPLAAVKPAPQRAAAPVPAFEEEDSSADAQEEEPPPPPPPPPGRRSPPAPPPAGARGRPEAPPPSPHDDSPPPARPAGRNAEPPRLFSETPAPAAKPLDDDPVRREVAERVLETAAELERLIKGKSEPPRPAPVNSDSTNNGADSAEKLLYVHSEDGEILKVSKERFLIGRGKHCDFVINSGKVSREHAAIVRDGAEFFIEDLGSSNGTWFNKQRIKRRKVEDGDEYFICSEKLKCLYR